MRLMTLACPQISDETVTSVLDFARIRIQEQRRVGTLLEIEHLDDRVGDAIEGSLANALPVQPVVFNEMGDGALVRHCAVNEIRPRPW